MYNFEFVQAFLDFAKEKYDLTSIGLLVAKFNDISEGKFFTFISRGLFF
ncbi:hypothetical protein G9F71_006740 [Clostridium sp. FP2]|nr:hypothetical protein [Clostridium sp. FP2]MBZ9622545.1 hypothetical protein [Clostridium sp. FP2]